MDGTVRGKCRRARLVDQRAPIGEDQLRYLADRIGNAAEGQADAELARRLTPGQRGLLDALAGFDGYAALRRRVQGYFELDLAVTDYRLLAEFSALIIDADTVVAALERGRALLLEVDAVLPLTLPGIMVGAFLTFVLCIGDYITPQVLGGNNELLMPQVIMLQIGRRADFPTASALAILLMIVVTIAYLGFARWIRLERA